MILYERGSVALCRSCGMSLVPNQTPTKATVCQRHSLLIPIHSEARKGTNWLSSWLLSCNVIIGVIHSVLLLAWLLNRSCVYFHEIWEVVCLEKTYSQAELWIIWMQKCVYKYRMGQLKSVHLLCNVLMCHRYNYHFVGFMSAFALSELLEITFCGHNVI